MCLAYLAKSRPVLKCCDQLVIAGASDHWQAVHQRYRAHNKQQGEGYKHFYRALVHRLPQYSHPMTKATTADL